MPNTKAVFWLVSASVRASPSRRIDIFGSSTSAAAARMAISVAERHALSRLAEIGTERWRSRVRARRDRILVIVGEDSVMNCRCRS